MTDLLGTIEAIPPATIDLDRWIALIAKHSNLAAVEPVVGINPFTREPTTFRPHPGSARVVVGGKEVGSMSWAVDGSPVVDVWGGERAAVEPVAVEVAEALGAVYQGWRV